MQSIYLLDIIGQSKANDSSYCGPTYWDWEDYVAVPALRSLGYRIIGGFYSTEKDSFGPLTRGVKVVKDGVTSVLWYG